MTPNAPHKDEPRRPKRADDSPEAYGLHYASEAYKSGIIEGLFAHGEIEGVQLLYMARKEKKPWFRPRQFLGYEALIRIPGEFVVQGTGLNPEAAILSALNSPSPFFFR